MTKADSTAKAGRVHPALLYFYGKCVQIVYFLLGIGIKLDFHMDALYNHFMKGVEEHDETGAQAQWKQHHAYGICGVIPDCSDLLDPGACTVAE